MKLDRRSFGMAVLAASAAPARAVQMTCGGGWEDDPNPWWPRSTTADIVQTIRDGHVSRMRPPTRRVTLDQLGLHIRRIFPQIVEQNVAMVRSRTLATYMRTVTDRELALLATLYTEDLNAQSRLGRALPVLAVRCDDAAQVKLARAFGAMPVYEALARYAPGKLPAFERSLAGQVMAGPPPDHSGYFVPNLDMTPLRVYEGFRVAPIGATSVPASLFMTGAWFGAGIQAAWTGGTWLGTNIVAPLIQYFAPSLWQDIGGTMNEIMLDLGGLGAYEISEAQAMHAEDFGVAHLSPWFEETGGDYGSVEAWSVAAGYSGGGTC